MWWWNESWPMPWMVGPLFMLIVMALCGAMMFFMMRGMMGGHGRPGGGAFDILKERFARREITQAEYEERRRLLDA
jgi:uncharacterized membrane protein